MRQPFARASSWKNDNRFSQPPNVEPGDLVQPSKVLLEIARSDGLDRDGSASDGLEVVVALDEKNFAPLQLQQPVQLIADAWPEHSVQGVVSFIAPAVDNTRGTIDVHIRVLGGSATADKAFLQGMTVSANIIAAERAATLVLPNDYLMKKDIVKYRELIKEMKLRR